MTRTALAALLACAQLTAAAAPHAAGVGAPPGSTAHRTGARQAAAKPFTHAAPPRGPFHAPGPLHVAGSRPAKPFVLPFARGTPLARGTPRAAHSSAALGGPARYDARRGAVLGGAAPGRAAVGGAAPR